VVDSVSISTSLHGSNLANDSESEPAPRPVPVPACRHPLDRRPLVQARLSRADVEEEEEDE